MTSTAGSQSLRSTEKLEKKTRSRPAKPPALATAAMKAVAGDGAPW